MVLGVTVKASANTSCRIRLYIVTPDTSKYYYLYDDYQTIWMPLSTSATTLNRIYLYLYDWSTASPSSGTYQIYIKDNVTIRPSWYDASLESGTYGESFADVDDWSSPSTDGDVATIEGDAWTHHYTNSPSFTELDNYYVEYRIKANKSISVRCFAYQSDSRGGDYSFYSDFHTVTTSWQMFKYY